MPFTPKTSPRPYSKGPYPTATSNMDLYFDTQLREISLSLKSLSDAILEIQAYLKTLP
jgi:hypothetical protein